jgi:DNA polymerase III subunit delta
MTPAQLMGRLQKRDLAPAYLFLGPEAYQRRRLKEALLAAALGDGGAQDGFALHDLAEVELAEVIDDARSLSLFASQRLIWVFNAEAALPKGKSLDEESGGEGPGGGDAAPLARYLKDPSPGVTLVFEAIRFEFEGDDKKKQERVRKFYASIKDVVELERFRADEARTEALALARAARFAIEPDALDLLVEALGADIARIAVEIEKLSLFAGERTVGADDIAVLVPDARATTIFALVNALGRRNRAQALGLLDTLTKEGEYLPLALTFLSTQFRLALAAREAGLRSSSQLAGHFSKLGVPMWPSRAEQVWQTVSKFSQPQLQRAIGLIFEADKGMRSARPDDRIVMERFVLELTA